MPSSKVQSNKVQSNKSPKRGATKRARANARPKAAPATSPFAETFTKSDETLSKLVVAGVALLGSGVLAATGFLLKDQLERLFGAALKSAAAGGASARDAAAEQLDLRTLLAHVGLQPKRHTMIGTTVGAFTGVIAGAALGAWLAPMLRQEVVATAAPAVDSKAPATNHSIPRAPSV